MCRFIKCGYCRLFHVPFIDKVFGGRKIHTICTVGGLGARNTTHTHNEPFSSESKHISTARIQWEICRFFCLFSLHQHAPTRGTKSMCLTGKRCQQKWHDKCQRMHSENRRWWRPALRSMSFGHALQSIEHLCKLMRLFVYIVIENDILHTSRANERRLEDSI